MRVGQGFDVHRFDDERGDFEIKLGGVAIPHDRRIIAHSDGDVVIHALCDALLGALALGDIGQHFPDTDPAYRDADSRQLLRSVTGLVKTGGFQLGNADITIIAERPRVMNYSDRMRAVLSEDMGADISQVSIKATTTEKAGFLGREEGIAAQAVVLLMRLVP